MQQQLDDARQTLIASASAAKGKQGKAQHKTDAGVAG
jgi:hypothetical protein